MWQKIKNIYHLFQSIIFALLYGFPARKLKIIGVTGTDGKTTTVSMIYQILKKAEKKVSMISSVQAVIGEKEYDTGFHITTPDPWEVQRYFAKIAKTGSEYVVLEVTSHGLDQNRVFGIEFLVGLITNITHEHLDYHKNWQNYALAKAKLLKNVKFSILNADDKSFEFLLPYASGKIVTYGIINNADFTPKNFPVKLKIPGEYNMYNALAATSACRSLGIDVSAIRNALKNFKNLKGRMEEIDGGQDFNVVVDFAHTPNALEQALKTLRSELKNKNSKLISVFGSAGLRDFAKRALMGQVSGELADLTVITDEDPRTEDPQKITAQIAKGCKNAGKKKGQDYFIVNDRTKAIQLAINLAKKDDVVGIFGKGHERSMCYGKKEYPWSDQNEARKAIKQRLRKKH